MKTQHIRTLVDAAVAVSNGTRFYVGDLTNRSSVHAIHAGTATSKLFGSNLEDPTVGTAANWVELHEFTASDLIYFEMPIRWVYGAVSAWTSGAVTLLLFGSGVE